MVLKNSVEACIEAVYLGEGLTSRAGRATTFVNPDGSIDFLVGKSIVINDPSYSKEKVIRLKELGNRVVSRVSGFEDTGIFFQPYIIRICPRLIWSGESYVTKPTDIAESIKSWIGAVDETLEDTSLPTEIIFPKVQNPPQDLVKDSEGNLTSFGWAIHQAGVNLVNEFRDMDLLKTKKIRNITPDIS